MAKPVGSKIHFRAILLRPKVTAEAVSWTFLPLPKESSAKLPSRGQTTVEGTLNGRPFRATLEPDGQGGHWLKVDRKVREAAGAQAGDVVTLEIVPVAQGAGRSAEGPRGRPAQGAGRVVGHHARRAQRLDSLDRLRQASRDARASDQECLRHARQREATPLLLRSVWDVQQKPQLPRRR